MNANGLFEIFVFALINLQTVLQSVNHVNIKVKWWIP